jgi:hypothetical protein
MPVRRLPAMGVITGRPNLRAKRQSKQNDGRFARRNLSSREIRFDGNLKCGERGKIATERERQTSRLSGNVK